jgi:hypothetical protein
MRKTLILLILLAAARAQGSGFPSLKLGADARHAAMGNAGTASGFDASAAFRNPAGLAGDSCTEAVFSLHRWMQGVKSGFLGIAFKGRKSGGAFHLLYTGVPDIEYRVSEPSPEPAGRFSSTEMAAGASYARALTPVLSAGVSLKFYYERIFVEEALGFGGDIGLSYALSERGLRIGAAVQNIGKTGKLASETIKLPLAAKAGVAAPLAFGFGEGLLLLDCVKERDSKLHVHGGAEFAWRKLLFLRAGYQTGYETYGFSGGIGFSFLKARLDYSLMPMAKGLGDSHRFSVNLIL